MELTVRLTEAFYATERKYHLDPTVRRERISFAFGRGVYGRHGLQTIMLAEPPILLDDDCYRSQAGGHVALDESVENAVLAKFAQSDFDVLCNIHDHWFSPGGTTFSTIDDRDDLQRARYLRGRFETMLRRQSDIGPARRVVSCALVLDQSGLGARIVDRRGAFRQVERVQVLGPEALQIIPSGAKGTPSGGDDRYLRQRDFITSEQQAFLAQLKIAVVGCGGTGSVVAESLVRLGVRNLMFFDGDPVEGHNLNRWQGGKPSDIGGNKAKILARRTSTLGGRDVMTTTAVPLSVFSPEAMPFLKTADIVIGCVDTHVGRNFLNRFSVQYMVPYFDVGVNIVAGEAVDFQSRYFAVIPGFTACAECTAYEVLDQGQIDRDLMDEVTAEESRRAGYVVNRPDIEGAASAYALNLGAVSTLMMELTNWICGEYRPLATSVAQWWRSGRYQRSDRDNHPETPSPTCVACSLIGTGDQAELPRPQTTGDATRMLAEARERLLPPSSQS